MLHIGVTVHSPQTLAEAIQGGVEYVRSVMGIPLNEADEQILAILAEGRATPKYLAEQTDLSRPYVSDRLTRLREHGLITRVSTGLYELSDVDEDRL